MRLALLVLFFCINIASFQKPPKNKKVLALVKKNPKSLASMNAIDQAFSSMTAVEQKEVVDLLTEHHKDNKGIVRVLNMATFRSVISLSELSGCMMTSNDEGMRQEIMALLAQFSDTPDGTSKKSLALYKQLKAWPNIAETNPKLYNRAKDYVYVAESLSIDQVAPDMVGTDEEGKKFKLSDYRGKVVLVTFWAMW